MSHVAVSDFPPGFQENPWSYGFALFASVLISALTLSHMLGYLFEHRRERDAQRLLGAIKPKPMPFWSVLNVHRQIMFSLMLTLFLRAAPDGLVMLAWGEGSPHTMRVLFALDRYWDGLALLPFVYASGLLAWGMQTIPQRLIHEAQIQLSRPQWPVVKAKVKIVFLALTIAIGVTLVKAGI